MKKLKILRWFLIQKKNRNYIIYLAATAKVKQINVEQDGAQSYELTSCSTDLPGVLKKVAVFDLM